MHRSGVRNRCDACESVADLDSPRTGLCDSAAYGAPPVVKSRAGAQFDFTLAAWQPAQLAGLQPDPHTAGPSAGA